MVSIASRLRGRAVLVGPAFVADGNSLDGAHTAVLAGLIAGVVITLNVALAILAS